MGSKKKLDAAAEKLKRRLNANPEAGEVIPHFGGLRKMRMALPGRGKRSGARVVYVLW